MAAVNDKVFDMVKASDQKINLKPNKFAGYAEKARKMRDMGPGKGRANLDKKGKIVDYSTHKMQTEVGEVLESFPGESSAMPHKKNPVHALVPVAALPLVATHLATLAGSQMHAHEREPGSWHTEWITLPVLTCLTLASVERVKEMISGLKINISQMRANLARTCGTLAAEE